MAADLEDVKSMWLSLRAQVDQLAAERQQFVDFFEQSPEAYVVTDVQGTIVDANAAAVDVLQRRRRYLAGQPLAALVALDRRAEFRSRLSRLVAREPAAARRFSTVFEAPELRTEASLSLRLIEREGTVSGVCWLLQPVQ